MTTDEKEKVSFSDMEEILEETEILTKILKETESYQRYKKNLAALKEQPEVYQKLNIFRRENIALQLMDHAEEYYEKTEELQMQYKDILMESVVMDFLTAEQAVCKMIRKVYDKISVEMQLDISYMDED